MANTTPENLGNPHYFHASVPEHKADLDDQAKNPQTSREGTGEKGLPMQGVVFQSREAKLLFEALEKPDHKYRQQARQAVRRFTAAVEKANAHDLIQDKGILIQEASQLYGIPASTIADWTDIGLITVHYRGRGKQGVYIDKQEIAAAAPIYHDAKQKREQPARRLKAMREQQVAGNPQPSRRTRS
jgi:hypothetical protein